MKIGPTTGHLEPAFNPFADDYLHEIIQAVATAWLRMKMPTASEIEDRITFRLAGRLVNDPLFAEFPYDVVAQHWLPDLDGQILGRLDLRFKHRHSRQDYFAFEAKRVHVTYPSGFKTEYSAYAAAGGMMCFITGQYSKDLTAGGMLGYVMDGDAPRAWKGLEKHIKSRRVKLRLKKNSQLLESQLISAVANGRPGTHLGETDHDLDDHALRLYHLLLPRVD